MWPRGKHGKKNRAQNRTFRYTANKFVSKSAQCPGVHLNITTTRWEVKPRDVLKAMNTDCILHFSCFILHIVYAHNVQSIQFFYSFLSVLYICCISCCSCDTWHVTQFPCVGSTHFYLSYWCYLVFFCKFVLSACVFLFRCFLTL